MSHAKDSNPSIVNDSTGAQNFEKSRRLPKYFPLVEPECDDAAKTFFKCFEEHTRMKSLKDKTSAKEALTICATQLDAYEACMNVELARKQAAEAKKSKRWWKFW